MSAIDPPYMGKISEFKQLSLDMGVYTSEPQKPQFKTVPPDMKIFYVFWCSICKCRQTHRLHHFKTVGRSTWACYACEICGQVLEVEE